LTSQDTVTEVRAELIRGSKTTVPHGRLVALPPDARVIRSHVTTDPWGYPALLVVYAVRVPHVRYEGG
jgi:hypothetical protein